VDIVSTRRIPKFQAIICIALGVLLLLLYVRPLTLLSVVRWKTRGKPEFWIVPRQLGDVSIDRTAGRNFTFYGYQFEVPWTDVKREVQLKNMELVFFSNNFVIMLHDPAKAVNQLKVLTREGTKDEAALKRLFGEETTRSNYALCSKIVNLTPRDLHLSFSTQKMVSSSVLLMLKPQRVGTQQGGLYSFQTEWLRGFQEGNPTRDKVVTIYAFDAGDHEIEISVGRGQGPSQDITQSELNRIIYSLRPMLASLEKPR
jgi:hypothetical protein